MIAIDEAKALYRTAGRDLNRDLSDFLDCGYVFATPDRLLLARPIQRADWRRWVTPAEADAWFVQLAVGRGSIRWFVEQMPVWLPWIAHRRDMRGDDRLHCVQTDQLMRRLSLNSQLANFNCQPT